MALSDVIRGLLGGSRSTLQASPAQEIGASGTAVYAGYVDQNEKSARLTGTERYRTFSGILANTSIAAASARYFLSLVGNAAWRVEPAQDTGQEARAEALAELVDAMLYDLERPWARVVRRAAMFQFHGFSIQEWTVKKGADGAFVLRDVAPRPQVTIERWETERESGKVLGVYQRSPHTGAEIGIPRWKVVYLVDDALSDSPEGLGLFRHVAEKAERLQKYEDLEGIGYEGDLAGIPIARAPLQRLREMVKAGDISEEARTAMIANVQNFLTKRVRNQRLGMLLDSLTYSSAGESPAPTANRQWDVELMQGGSAQSAAAIHTAIERVNREIARVLGTEQLLLGGDGKGSLALSEDKSQTFGLMVDGTLTTLAETFQSDLIRPMFLLNGWPEELIPTLKTSATALRDVTKITGALQQMANAGAVLDPSDPAIREVRDLLGLSRPPEIDDLDASALGDGSEDEPEDEPADDPNADPPEDDPRDPPEPE